MNCTNLNLHGPSADGARVTAGKPRWAEWCSRQGIVVLLPPCHVTILHHHPGIQLHSPTSGHAVTTGGELNRISRHDVLPRVDCCAAITGVAHHLLQRISAVMHQRIALTRQGIVFSDESWRKC
jgi:hypothetical protein